MLAPKARWSIGEAEADVIETLSRELKVDPLVARILALRGISSIDEAERFINGGKEHFHDPFLLDGMQPAVARIREALDEQQLIRVYGDYDADGVSSTSLMVHLLRGLGARFDTYIPHRVREGYGLNREAVERARDAGVALVITVDTGISAVDEVAYIRELGMDVIVTDHHEPPEKLPEALAVINPKKPGCPYPYKQLAGVGVALKLAHALLGRLPEELLELAAIGTVADLMPLTDENRLIVKLGLARMQAYAYAGIRALIAASGIERKEITASHIGFSLAPRINASGRLEDAADAVTLLTTDDELQAERIAYELDELNKERQRIVEDITKEAVEAAEAQRALGLDKAIVVASEGWNVGVIGIVASRLVERFYRPAIVLGIDPATGMAKGSARSIHGFDMYKALTQCEAWLDHYGGHQAAAGMSLNRDDLPAFAAKLNELAAAWLSDEDLVPLLKADAACSLSEVPISSIEGLERLAPYGMGNPTPRFVFTDLTLGEIRTMGKEKQHLKLALSQAQAETAAAVEAVGFGKGCLSGLMAPAARLDVLGELSINEWNGVRKPQILLQDLRIPHFQLFDWRGATQMELKLAGLTAALAAAPGDGAPPAVVLFAEADQAGYAKAALPDKESLPLYVLQADGTPRPANAEGERHDLAALPDVVLYSAPGSVEQLRSVVRAARSMARCYAVFAELRPMAAGAMPSRDTFKLVYGTLLKQGGWDVYDRALMQAFSKRSGLSPAMIEFILQVFEELGFIGRSGSRYQPHDAPVKKDLSTSRLYREREGRQEVESLLLYASAKELEQWIVAHKEKEKMEEWA
ncbi:single-stranded-DNA-specific exonuclease RecJ [Paenibacillus athensensis]|uniref:Single-stranded-DNA-specific exonuclease RecJ n=1 Tax=Paenibacillus athensensis TaxID=1967502 RepID=A0A4Y8Q1N9_9BACL|nr:single-stranded-DNA-specific exonuclease RecJ [Paenibacillus athensensis]MCD1258250.1 single-stranded-DNA-specific exonuclease RecJ [Paenibacillus athensensis]